VRFSRVTVDVPIQALSASYYQKSASVKAITSNHTGAT
jgi:hypothetical protein